MKKMKKSELNYLNNELNDILGKKVIVTGANSGIGFAICDILLKKNAHVVMACRDYEKALKAKEELLSNNPNGKLDLLLYNQSSVAGAFELSQCIIAKHSDFYALILNAGLISNKKDELYGNKVSQTIGVNYISTMAICYGLKEFLDKSEVERRIIFQGSLAGRKCSYKKKEEVLKTNSQMLRQYNISKLGVFALFQSMRDTNENPNVFFVYAEPGVTNTKIIRNFCKGIQKLGYIFLKVFMHSNYSGALTACYSACNLVANGDMYIPKGLGGVNGLPKKLKKKYPINNQILTDGRHLLGEINDTRW